MEATQNVRVPVERLYRFVEAVLRAVDVPEDDARVMADNLVQADLRGVSTHGVNILARNARGLKIRAINPRPTVRVVEQRGATAVVDGDRGLGQVVGARSMEVAIARAREYGVGAVVARNSNHFGAAAYFAMMALEHDMIGFAATNAPAIMAPWGGVTPTLGNNPFAWAIPAGRETPLVLDMATSQAARMKIRAAAARGEKIPLGWAADAKGRPTDDPNEALRGLLLPVGGVKGYGLALVMEVLAGVLSGALVAKNIPRSTLHGGAVIEESWQVGHVFLALDVAHFMAPEVFVARMEDLVAQVRSSELAEGVDRVYLPGEIEALRRRENQQLGVPLHRSVVQTLNDLAAELGLDDRLP